VLTSRKPSGDIDTLCEKCNSCAQVNFKPKQVYVPWYPAKFPFERIHLDFFHFRHSNYLIICDSFSKWIDVIAMARLTAAAVVEVLCRTFSLWGLPRICVTDNGPPFDSGEFVQFLTKLNVELKHSPVGHPEGNGLAERGVQVTKKALEKLTIDDERLTADKSPQSLDLKISSFLFNYRNTPSTVTQKSPNDVLLSFKPKTFLTQLNPKITPVPPRFVDSPFREGDPVLARIAKTVVKGTVVRQLGPTRYLVNIEGVIKHAHVNQLKRAI